MMPSETDPVVPQSLQRLLIEHRPQSKVVRRWPTRARHVFVEQRVADRVRDALGGQLAGELLLVVSNGLQLFLRGGPVDDQAHGGGHDALLLFAFLVQPQHDLLDKGAPVVVVPLLPLALHPRLHRRQKVVVVVIAGPTLIVRG
eukprot:scaffold72624_cov33-Attheya_sp.AAC.1